MDDPIFPFDRFLVEIVANFRKRPLTQTQLVFHIQFPVRVCRMIGGHVCFGASVEEGLFCGARMYRCKSVVGMQI